MGSQGRAGTKRRRWYDVDPFHRWQHRVWIPVGRWRRWCLVEGEKSGKFFASHFLSPSNETSLTTRKVTSATPKYAGRYYLTSNISPASPFYATAESMAGTGNYMSMGRHHLVAAMRLGDRSYYTFAGLSLPESWKSDNAALLEDPEALRRKLVTEYFSDWSKTNTDLVAHSDGEFYIWPLYGLAAEEMEWQTVPGVALVGDAAHIS